MHNIKQINYKTIKQQNVYHLNHKTHTIHKEQIKKHLHLKTLQNTKCILK